MAALRKPFGFKPHRSLNGNFNPATRRYIVNATHAQPIYAGDLVVLVSGISVNLMATATADTCLGVVAGLLDTNQKPLVFSQPTRGPYLPAATGGFADVYSDPENTYWAATDVTAAASNVNNLTFVTASDSGTGNTGTGRSPRCVGLTTTTVAATPNFPLQILGPSPAQRDYLTNVDWTEGVEVVIRSDNII